MMDAVIVNYHSSRLLLKCLASISRASHSAGGRLIICENGPDDIGDRLERSFPHALYIKNKKNLGFAAAVNIGIRQSDAPYLMILNPDTSVCENFFDSVNAYMNENRQVGVLGPKVLNEDGTIQGSARSFPTPLTGLFGRTSFLTRFFPANRLSRKNVRTDIGDQHIAAIPVDWVSGACMVVRREAVEDVGLLDERFFMYWEDADWCRRMKSHGWQVVYYPGASIVHAAGKSSEKRRLRSLLAFHLSAYRYFAKYVKWPLTIFKPFVFMALALRFYGKCLGMLMIRRSNQRSINH
ncbi:MAG: glycosyltransferase family 2 protein [Desulfobacterales bacterium]|jgi:GT2 family glycosyltransferase|nr:glycosyltransferase family 2 protein [Desulfobacterales bacterium]